MTSYIKIEITKEMTEKEQKEIILELAHFCADWGMGMKTINISREEFDEWNKPVLAKDTFLNDAPNGGEDWETSLNNFRESMVKKIEENMEEKGLSWREMPLDELSLLVEKYMTREDWISVANISFMLFDNRQRDEDSPNWPEDWKQGVERFCCWFMKNRIVASCELKNSWCASWRDESPVRLKGLLCQKIQEKVLISEDRRIGKRVIDTDWLAVADVAFMLYDGAKQ